MLSWLKVAVARIVGWLLGVPSAILEVVQDGRECGGVLLLQCHILCPARNWNGSWLTGRFVFHGKKEPYLARIPAEFSDPVTCFQGV
jgi:hypothetical protein